MVREGYKVEVEGAIIEMRNNLVQRRRRCTQFINLEASVEEIGYGESRIVVFSSNWW